MRSTKKFLKCKLWQVGVWGVHDVIVVIVWNGLSEPSSNPGQDCLLFILN